VPGETVGGLPHVLRIASSLNLDGDSDDLMAAGDDLEQSVELAPVLQWFENQANFDHSRKA
jgi:hypothetical protein